MNKNKTKRVVSIFLTLLLLMSSIIYSPTTVRAAGWLDYAQNLTLGNMVSGSLNAGDYRGKTEDNGPTSYWNVYRFTMPKDGLLNLYIESASSEYLTFARSTSHDGFVIYSASDPDKIVWCAQYGKNAIDKEFSASRGVYYGTTEIPLNHGDYYFAIRKFFSNSIPYYLTLSYKEPIINVTSIALNPSKLTLDVGEKRTIIATVLPNNATDKTLLWKTSNPSVAIVENSVISAISNGVTTITAASLDGEISATCEVTVSCNHDYQTTVTPADTDSDGNITEACSKCGDQTSQTIYKINDVILSKTSYIYNGRTRKPSVSVMDAQGNVLVNDRDYKVSYPESAVQVGLYDIKIEFMGNYSGTIIKRFRILPKSTSFTKVSSRAKSITLKWKQASADCGYEIAYSTNEKFRKKSTRIIDIRKNKTVSKTIAHLEPGKRYYLRIRTYKNIIINGNTTKLYSNWSKIMFVNTKK